MEFLIEKTNTFIYFFPVFLNFISEFKIIRKNKLNRLEIQGYLYTLCIPIVLIHISSSALEENLSHIRHYSLISIISTLISYYISQLFFFKRTKSLNLHYGTPQWFMNRLYREIIYALLLAIPALVKFYIFK